MTHMGSQRGGIAISTNNYSSVTGSGGSKRLSIQYDKNGRIYSMVISKITTVNYHVYSNYSTKHDDEIGYNSNIEINSHADTHFFGNNF